MASKAPLVLAAALFVLGIAGLARTIRQTGDEPSPMPEVEMVSRALAPSTSTPSVVPAAPTPMDAVSDVEAPSSAPSALAPRPPTTVLAPAAERAVATPTEEPTPEPHGGAIAAGVASDGDHTVPASATTVPLHPLRFGMVANGESAGTATAGTPAATPGPAATATETPAP